ncbi:MAG TPA: hypothetical protein VKQ36_14765 [Ktedonobacterales bacterium]|nr:hypothetical protein [Ktedonobacterales bacterium]
MARLVEYQSLLSQPKSRKQIEMARQAIERLGGKVFVDMPQENGTYVVILWLPESYRPDDVLPGIPFYPV